MFEDTVSGKVAVRSQDRHKVEGVLRIAEFE